MALFRKLGGLLSQTASRNLLSESCVTKPSILQAMRCMSSMASSKLFVGGLSYATDDFQLKEAFTKYGEVTEARVIVDRETGRSRGFGFVTFTSTEEASSAIQAMDGQALYGRNVRVNYATERTRGGFGGGGGYGSNYGGPGGAYGDGYGGSNYGPGGGNYGPPGANYGPPGGNYGPPGGNYGPPGGNYGPPGGNYGPPGGDYAPSGGVGGGSYGGSSSPDFGTGSQYTGGSTYGNVAGGGGGSASFEGSSAGSGFEGSPDFSFGSGDQIDTDDTDKIDESTGGFEEGDIVDGNYRDEDDGDFAKRA